MRAPFCRDELRKAESRLTDLRKGVQRRQRRSARPWNCATRRVISSTAELKVAVTRAEADVAGIKRELGRLGN